MSPVQNRRLSYNSHPTGNIIAGETTKLVSDTIDLDTVPLNGGFLLKTLALSSDPYLRARMREPEIQGYSPAFPLHQPYVVWMSNTPSVLMVSSDLRTLASERSSVARTKTTNRATTSTATQVRPFC